MGEGREKVKQQFHWMLVAAALAVHPFSALASEPGPMLAEFLEGEMNWLEEVVFAVRGLGRDGHWYANFGHHVRNPKQMMYGAPGGRLCRLNLQTGELKVLLDDPEGGVRDPHVHYDAQKILFSYRPGGTKHYHLYEINVDGTGLRQITDGPHDDLEGVYLPDGDLMFCSSRCNRFVNCWFTQVAVLYRCNANGGNIRQLSANIEQDNTPWMLPDGRVMFMRWEYVDRSRVKFHHLWTINPDGTGQMVLFGNMHAGTAMLDAKPIPGTHKVVASFSPGHGRKEHAGHVTVVDPRNGPDDKAKARNISREADWRDPYAFSEGCFLVARNRTLCIMNGKGETEPIYTLPDELKHLDVHEPRPLRARPREPRILSRTDWSQATGRLVLTDVTRGRNMEGVEPGDITQLLVLETLPKPVNFSGTMEPITMGGSFTLPRILGTVPVEPDGSAHMEVPALRPLFFVALDKQGLSVKRMQSFVSVMPGETTGCVGCHEHRAEPPEGRADLAAMRRAPSRIQPFARQPDVFEFPRDVQPILDRHCVRCHNYEKYAGRLALTGDHSPWYSHAYAALMSRGHVSHGRDAMGNIPPRKIGSSASPLIQRLLKGHSDVKLSEREFGSLQLWIDSGAPYPGTYASLGTGMVRFTPDADVLQRRCARCHAPQDKSKGKKPPPKPRLPGHTELHANLTRPEKSIILLAPLAKTAGGLQLCGKTPVFADTGDPDYRRLLGSVEKARAALERVRRFDMPEFRPNGHYIREMQRYGILPPNHDPQAPCDAYAVDERYWQSFWHLPDSR